MAAAPEKCDVRGCKCAGQPMKPCAGPSCNKFAHTTCFVGVICVKFKDVPNLGGDLFACSKKCAVAATSKDKNGGDNRRSWENDSKVPGGMTSSAILLDWWTEEGNYSKYKGKDNEGKKKKQFAEELARKMREETTSTQRTWKQVQTKIDAMATRWREVHDWTQKTGTGLEEADKANGTQTLRQAVEKMCSYYYKLEPILWDRASTKPRATNYGLNFEDSSDDDEGGEKEDDDDEAGVQSILEDLPDTIDIDGGVAVEEVAAMPETNDTAPPPPSATKTKKKRKASNASASDDSLYGGSSLAGIMAKLGEDRKTFKKARFKEIIRHNTKMETIQERQLDITQQQFQLRQQQEKLSLTNSLVDTYEKYKAKGYSSAQMVRLVPALQDVIDAVEE